MRILHHSAKPLPPIYSVGQEDKARTKPKGLWISIEGEDDWRSWCEAEGFAQDRFTFTQEITLVDNANILHLSSVVEIDRFHEEYSDFLIPNHRYSRYINWHRVARDHQGIIITPYQWSRRFDGEASNWYYGWDCASGCIWDADAVAFVNESQEAA